mgnify:CR=1 FL=1
MAAIAATKPVWERKLVTTGVGSRPQMLPAARFADEAVRPSAVRHPVSIKRTRGVSVTGFTQKRHTLLFLLADSAENFK